MKTIRHIASVLLISIMLFIPTAIYLFMNHRVPNSLDDALLLLGMQFLWILIMIKSDAL